jgi:signal-transduction protein with cAMP-binding, CBS, and nucleotidyltransferase domain
MICPTCGWDNLPGNEECSNCLQDLTPLDRPAAADRVEKSLMEDLVSSLRPKSPTTIRAETTVRDAIRAMLANNIGALLVVDKVGKLLGIFSERDLLKKVAGIFDPYDNLVVGDFMTPNPETVSMTDTLAFALHKMDCGGYRHLPVVAEGRPAGVISVRDMLRHITRLCKGSC